MKLQDLDFRIWNNSTNKFIELNISYNIRAIPRKNDDLVLELWSGFYDSKGTRIYENDIIRTDKGEIFSVVQDGEITAWGLLKNGCPYCSLAEVMFESDRVEVLGNIHENAKLSKEKVIVKCKYGDMYDSKGFPKY